MNEAFVMRGSRSMAQLTMEFLVKTMFPFIEKYTLLRIAGAVLLDPRLFVYRHIIQRQFKVVFRISHHFYYHTKTRLQKKIYLISMIVFHGISINFLCKTILKLFLMYQSYF